MRELALPAATLLLSVLATYWFCLRPMRRGSCGFATARTADAGSTASSAEVQQLRDEIRALSRQIDAVRPQRTTSTGATHQQLS